ncbi:hypothetical protein TUMEXPCC7403_19500 [Tumidithrix helvetica PCC 7403]
MERLRSASDSYAFGAGKAIAEIIKGQETDLPISFSPARFFNR